MEFKGTWRVRPAFVCDRVMDFLINETSAHCKPNCSLALIPVCREIINAGRCCGRFSLTTLTSFTSSFAVRNRTRSLCSAFRLIREAGLILNFSLSKATRKTRENAA
jgi:hypothetical protein